MNPYSVLGVDRDADEDEVKEAYRELAKEHHPDRGGDEEKFKEIQAAYDEITSEDDEPWEESGFGSGPGRGFNGKEKNVEDFINDFHEFASRGGFDRRGFQGNPFEAAGRQQQIIHKMSVEFQTAVLGGEVTVRLSGPNVGSSKRNIEIPPGVKSGSRVNYSGNLSVEFNVRQHPKFWRENANDIYTAETVSATEAMTGTEIETTTIQGEVVKFEVDPGSNPGELFRLPGKGGPETYEGISKGDMYVKLSVDVPKITDEEDIQLIEKLNE